MTPLSNTRIVVPQGSLFSFFTSHMVGTQNLARVQTNCHVSTAAFAVAEAATPLKRVAGGCVEQRQFDGRTGERMND